MLVVASFHAVNEQSSYTGPFHQNPRALKGWRIRKLSYSIYSSLSGDGGRGRGQTFLTGVCGRVFVTVPLATEIENQNYTLACGKWLKIIPLNIGNIIKITTFHAFVRNCSNVAKILCGLKKKKLIHKPHSLSVPYHTMHYSEQKCAYLCSEWCIVGYGTDALWDLWNWYVR